MSFLIFPSSCSDLKVSGCCSLKFYFPLLFSWKIMLWLVTAWESVAELHWTASVISWITTTALAKISSFCLYFKRCIQLSVVSYCTFSTPTRRTESAVGDNMVSDIMTVSNPSRATHTHYIRDHMKTLTSRDCVLKIRHLLSIACVFLF